MDALWRGKRVETDGALYEELRRGRPTGRIWTMVREPGTERWQPAFTDELEDIPRETQEDVQDER